MPFTFLRSGATAASNGLTASEFTFFHLLKYSKIYFQNVTIISLSDPIYDQYHLTYTTTYDLFNYVLRYFEVWGEFRDQRS